MMTPLPMFITPLITPSPVIVLRSLRDVHKMIAYRADHVCPSVHQSVCLHNATRDPLDRFG
jgi:hypothetical protein